MVKMIFLVILAVNLALFGMIKGLWGAKASESHEPNRVLAQMNADQIHVISTLQDGDTSVAPNAEVLSKDEAAGVEMNSPQAEVPTVVTPPSNTPQATADAIVTAPVAIPAENPAAPVASPPLVQAETMTAAVQETSKVAPKTIPTPAPTKADIAPPVAAANTAMPKNNNLMCLEAGYFVLADARQFETQINRIPLGMKEVRKSVEEVVSYMVRIPANNGQAGANRRAAELQRAGVHDFYIVPGTYSIENLRWSVSLGVFRTETAAKTYMRELTAKGIKQMVITPRKATSSKIAYQFKNVTPAQRSQIEKVLNNFSAQDLHHC